MISRQDLLRGLPRVDDLMDHAQARALAEKHSQEAVLTMVRTQLDLLRAALLASESFSDADRARTEPAAILAAVEAVISKRLAPVVARVINATGVVLHTGLGRAPLAPAARAAIDDVARGYSLLEVDRDTGERGTRETSVAALLCTLTGAEAATVVNNNAGATLIILAALARGREVICSRGQLVEIGGSFRIPDVMAESGAQLVEVGSTNKTHLRDYERAITPNTAALLRVHTSNFRIQGFTQEVSTAELAALGAEHGLPVIDDLGSGAMIDLAPHGLEGEPLVSSSLVDGAAVACFSGDKLLGGPQAGLIVGNAEEIALIRRHPLFRALRPGKLTLAGLEATLKLYLNLETFAEAHPTFSMLTTPAAQIKPRAEALAKQISEAAPTLAVVVAADTSQPGSGSMPTVEIPTWVVRLSSPEISAKELGNRMRAHTPPVFTRVHKELVHLDPRTLLPGDEEVILAAIRAATA